MRHVKEVSLMAIPLALVLVIQSCAYAGEFSGLAAGVVAMYSRPAPVVPPPPPAPSGVCENCNGRGKVGDGTVMVTCPECDGTGKRRPTVKQSLTVPPSVKPALIGVNANTPAGSCANGQCVAPAVRPSQQQRRSWFIRR